MVVFKQQDTLLGHSSHGDAELSSSALERGRGDLATHFEGLHRGGSMGL